MPVARILFLAFLLVPLAEIWLLLEVGGVIGALPTIGLVVLTAVLGAALIRIQGIATLARVQGSLDRGELPAVELLEGAMLLVAGALLLTPGFLTDTLGFLLLVPSLRRAVALGALSHGIVRMRGAGPGGGSGPGTGPGGRVIDGEFRREDP